MNAYLGWTNMADKTTPSILSEVATIGNFPLKTAAHYIEEWSEIDYKLPPSYGSELPNGRF